MNPEQIIAAAKRARRRMAVYRHNGEIVATGTNSSKDQALRCNPRAELIGVYGKAAKPEWIAEDLDA